MHSLFVAALLSAVCVASASPFAPSVMCPDGGQCPAGNTCCETTTSGQYGCCPLVKAVCCSDHLHCCPDGYTCDVSAGTCLKGDKVISFFTKIEAKTKQVICPDGQSQCPDNNTCCMLSSGQYGCCPLPQAVCCSDHLHCCPNGYTCDVSDNTCTMGDKVVQFFTKIEATKTKNVVCPGGTYQCPDGNTCCRLSSGEWGCCPIPNAVCCSDHLYCCPNGYTCDVSADTCTKGDKVVPFLTKIKATKTKNVVCPGGTDQCPDGNTCCKLSSGEWGCCPLPNAVCCSDHLHCCPSGYTCDVTAGTCLKGDEIIPFFLKRPARPTYQWL